MQELPVELADWLRKGQVGYLPLGFEAYCQVLHPFEIATREKTLSDSMVDKTELETRNNLEAPRHFSLLNSDGVDEFKKHDEERLRKRAGKIWTPVSWRAVAERFGLSFDEHTSLSDISRAYQMAGEPEDVWFPSEGYLPRKLLIQLLEVLKSYSSAKEVLVFQSAPNTIGHSGKAEELVKCTYVEVLEYFPQDFIGYLYPEDKSWIVLTDIDTFVTIVGGPEALIEKLKSGNMELLSYNPDP